jgi:hypothetical protein
MILPNEIKVHLDTTSNVIKVPYIKKQIEDQLRNNFEKDLPNVLKRMGEIPSFLTADVGFYSKLLEEAKKCYRSGLYYATVSMVGIASERFAIELAEKMKFKVNEQEITERDLFEAPIQKQLRRLNLLAKSKVLKEKYAEKLKEIDAIRNKYIHPREEGDAEQDSLKVLKLFIEILNSRFSDEYIIKNGKIVKKNF